jgi:hypothetical protein
VFGPSTSTYSSSGPTEIASDAGSVHGVVVQIGSATSTSSGSSLPKARLNACGLRAL